jgi:hypothetical protein
LLVAVFDSASLAAGISRAFERESNDAPLDTEIRSPPSIEGIRGVLKAIEEQTAAFQWQRFLQAVANQLGYSDEDAMYVETWLIHQ